MPRPTFKKSIVWTFFDPSADGKTVTCRICRKSYTNHKNTSNFKEHLKRVHPIQLQQEEDVRAGNPTQTNSEPGQAGPSSAPPRPVSTLSTVDGSSAPAPPAKRSRQLRLYAGQPAAEMSAEETRQLDEALVRMVVIDYQPLSIVEDRGFSMFVKKLNPRYQLPSRKTLSEKLLPEYYEKKKQEFMDQLKVVTFVSLTADYWKALNNKTFLSLTAHYIYGCSLVSTTLATAEVKVSHTSENTAAVMKEICDAWDVTDKVVTVVTDNAANMRKAVADEFGKYNHPCVAHTLNLAVNDAIAADPDLNVLLAKCRGIVTHFRQSSVAAYKLKEIQAELHVAELVLMQDVVTRWNSTYVMVERLIQVQQPLCLALLQLERAPENLSGTEWATLKDLLPILKPFLELTRQLSGDKYVTMSIIIPLVRGLRFALRMVSPITDIGTRLRETLTEHASRRLGCLESNKIVAKSTFLDPRFKKTGFGYEDHASTVQQWVLDELTRLEVAESTACERDNPHTQNQHEVVGNDLEDATSNEVNIWSHFDQKALEQRHHTTPNTTAIIMIRQYIEMPLLDRRRDPLQYWNDHKKTFPGLYKMAQKYLSIPASSVPSERVFSKAGYILTERRNRLSSSKLNEIIFLNNNI